MFELVIFQKKSVFFSVDSTRAGSHKVRGGLSRATMVQRIDELHSTGGERDN